MAELTKGDLRFIVSRIPKDVQEIIKQNGFVLAGGFIRATITGEKISDIDLFGPNADVMKTVAYKMATERRGRVHESKNALTVLAPPRFPVQFITRWLFTHPGDVVASFDFTICQAAVWFSEEKWVSKTCEDFYADLAAKRLVYTCPQREEAAGGSMLRVRKFLSKGYSIQAESLANVIARLVSKVRFSERNSEEYISAVIMGFLREVDPLTVVDGIDVVDEHQIQV